MLNKNVQNCVGLLVVLVLPALYNALLSRLHTVHSPFKTWLGRTLVTGSCPTRCQLTGCATWKFQKKVLRVITACHVNSGFPSRMVRSSFFAASAITIIYLQEKDIYLIKGPGKQPSEIQMKLNAVTIHNITSTYYSNTKQSNTHRNNT